MDPSRGLSLRDLSWGLSDESGSELNLMSVPEISVINLDAQVLSKGIVSCI
jgi:hypothetical protein